MNRTNLSALAIAAAVLVGCDKKESAAPPEPTAASNAASASAAASAAAPTQAPLETSVELDPVKAAATASAPVEPNAPPPHADHERAAAQIHKGNYKNELDSLEKEDLSVDRK